MPKSNIRERAANKLQASQLLLQRIIEGKPVSVDSAKKALKDIEEIMAWLDKREYKTDKS
jgi:hypothetical protein